MITIKIVLEEIYQILARFGCGLGGIPYENTRDNH
jgi:hypothetical protein